MRLIVPHHSISFSLIHLGMASAARNLPSPKRIILIALDHFGRATSSLIKAAPPWPMGRYCDEEVLEKLILPQQDSIALRDHSVTEMLGPLQKYWGATKFTVIMNRSKVSHLKLLAISRQLAHFLRDQELLLLSTDLSHYLPVEASRREDDKTVDVFQTFCLYGPRKIRSDTQQGARPFMMTMKELGCTDVKLIARGNSVDFGESTAGYAALTYGSALAH